MGFSVILPIILSLSFDAYAIDLAMIIVKLTPQVFRSIVAVCSLYLLGIVESQENRMSNGIASEFVTIFMTTAVVLVVLPFYSFLRVWRKCFHCRPYRYSVVHDLTRVITFTTTIFLLEPLKIEFGGSTVPELFLTMIAAIIISVFLLIWMLLSHSNDIEASLPDCKIQQMFSLPAAMAATF